MYATGVLGGGVAVYHFRLCPLSRYLVCGQLIGGAVDPSIAPSQVEWQFSGGYVAPGRRVIASVRDVNFCLVACLCTCKHQHMGSGGHVVRLCWWGAHAIYI